MALTTRTRLRQDAARLTGLLLWSGTATGGSTSALTHTGSGGLRDSGMSTYLFEGGYLHITGTTDDAAPLGEWRMITPTGYDPTASTLQITVGEVFSAPIEAGDSYEIIAGLDPEQWNDTINDVLTQQLRHKWRSPISLIEDADMEAATTASWTATDATLTKEVGSNVLEGAQSLRVVNSGAGGSAQSGAVAVNPGEALSAWADYRSHVGTAVLRAYDVTNSAVIASGSGADGGDNRAGGGIVLHFSAPVTCREVALRLEGTEAAADIYWENIILMGSRLRYGLPAWIEERDQFSHVEARSGDRPSDYQFSSLGAVPEMEETLTAQQAFRVVLPFSGAGAYFASGDKKFTALSTEAATTSAPLEWAKYEVASAIYEIMGDEWRPRTRNYVGRNEVEKHLHSLRQLNQPREPKPVGGKRPWVASRGFQW